MKTAVTSYYEIKQSFMSKPHVMLLVPTRTTSPPATAARAGLCLASAD